MNLPWCADIVQKLQPPKHPRCIFTENLIISYAGIGPLFLYFGCGNRVYGKSNELSISPSVIVGNGGLITVFLSPTFCTILSANVLLDSCSTCLKFAAKAFLSFRQIS